MTGFYVTGGTLRHDAACYVERQADKDLLDGLLKGEFCYVLTSRQMGKSSLMVRTASKLREQGIHVAVLDLTAIGQNLTPEQWYDGLSARMGRQLDLEDELEAFWEAHRQVGPCQRLFAALRDVVLPKLAGGKVGKWESGMGDDSSAAQPSTLNPQPSTAAPRLVIFVDELDVVRSLPFSTDEFFAAIRECYNRRAEDPEINRITFCLLGVATPSDLIRDTRLTPFNIGRRIELNDFTPEEAAPLAKGLVSQPSRLPKLPPAEAMRRAGPSGGQATLNSQILLDRILYWTNGHPYLTQRLCHAIAQDAEVRGRAGVDRLCEAFFLSHRARERDDNLLFVRERLLRNEADPASLLHVYDQVRAHKRVRDDETNPLVSLLRLSGITRVVEGYLWVRNRIYYRVFDREWIRANMPDAEVRRQRAAFWRGVARTTAVAALVIVAMAALMVYARHQARVADEQRRLAEGRLYAADMHLAYQAWQEDNFGVAKELLEAHRHHQPDLRGFEWRYLWGRCRGDSEFILRGHSNNVRYVFFSPDGASLASRAMDKVVKVWDLATRRERFSLTNAAALAGFTPDSAGVVVGQGDGWVRFHDAHTGRLLRTLLTDGLLIGLGADGNTAATTSTNYAVKFWDLSGGQVKSELPGEGGVSRTPDSEYLRVAISPDGTKALVKKPDTGGDWEIKIQDAVSGSVLRVNTGMVLPRDAAFSPNGQWVALATFNGQVWIWETTANREPLVIQAGDATVWSVAFSPDGGRLATAGSDQTVRVWDTATGRLLMTFKGHENGAQSVAFSPDGQWLASGSRDETIRIWKPEVATVSDAPTNINSGILFSPEAKLIAALTRDRVIKIWDVATLRETMQLPLSVLPLHFSPDGKSLLSVDDNGFIFADLQNRENWKTVPVAGGLSNASFGPYCVARDCVPSFYRDTLRLHEVRSGRQLAVFAAHHGGIQAAAMSPDGRLVVSAGRDGTIAFWDVGQRRHIASILAHKYFASSLAFSPDGTTLASGGGDNTVRLWDVAGRTLRATLKGHRQFIGSLAFSPDGKTLASSGTDGTVRLWNPSLQQSVASFKFQESESKGVYVSNLAFSPDGNALAARGEPGILKVWRAASWSEIQVDEKGPKL